MALTEEQRSLLQLLLQGQSYEDIGSLLGVDAPEVGARARGALAEMGGRDPDAGVELSDFLLGQADPIGRADAARQLQNDPDSNALAQSLVAQLRLLAPQAQLPDIPPLRGGRSAEPAAPPAPSPADGAPREPGEGIAARIGSKLPGLGADGSPQSRTLIALGLAGALVIAIVLALVLGGGDDGDEDTASEPADSGEPTVVQLGPLQEGSEAGGQAAFLAVQGQQVLQLNLFGLERAPRGQTYIVWFYASDRSALPVAQDQPAGDGSLTGTLPIAEQLAPALAQFGCIDISIASAAEAGRAITQARNDFPRHVGESVLRGQIPAAPGEAAPSGGASQCEPPAAAEQPAG